MTRGKHIRMYLIDADVNGRIKCSLQNWTGIAYKIPRTLIEKSKNLAYVNQSGVYFLFGTDSDNNPVVYIGQAGTRKNGKGLLARIQEPHKTIDYWTEAIMFTVTNNSFGPTEISYLENRFCNLAIDANRYIVKNANDPSPGNITEEIESELEDFVDYTKLFMGVLGHKVFEPYISVNSDDDHEPLLLFEYGTSKAKGKITREGFVVLKGSTINPKTVKTCPQNALAAREKYAKAIDNNTLKSDVLLSSPSAAAAFCGGASLSGNIKWKNEDGIPLGELEKISDSK